MKNKALLSLCLSMIIFGTIGIFVKYINLPSAIIAFVRGIVGAAVLAIACKNKIWCETLKKNFVLLAVSGMFIGANWVFLFEAYKHTTVSAATVCYYLAPMFVMLVSPFVFKERFTVKKVLCMLTAFFGTLLVSDIFSGKGTLEEGSFNIIGILLAIAAAVLYATVVITNKRIKDDIPALSKTAVQLFFAALAVLPYTFFAGEWQNAEFTVLGTALLIVAGVVHTGIAYLLYFGSIPKLPAQTAALFSYIDPVSAILLSAVFLNEKLSLQSGIGAVLVIASAMLCEIDIKIPKGNKE